VVTHPPAFNLKAGRGVDSQPAFFDGRTERRTGKLKMGVEGLEPPRRFRFTRYGLAGLFEAAGAPLLFKRQKPIQ